MQYARETAAPSGDAIGSDLSNQEWYRTQDYLLTSRQVAQRAVERLALHKDRAFARKDGDTRERSNARDTTERLLELVRIQRIENTRLVKVHVDDTEPKRAAALANAVAQSYIEIAVEDRLASAKHALGWLSEQMAQARNRLVKSESEIHANTDENSDTALPLPERQALVAEQIKQHTYALSQARVRRIELEARLNRLRATLRLEPFQVHAADINEMLHVKALRSAYATASIRLRELQAAQEHDGQEIQALEVRLAALREQMRLAIDGALLSAEGDFKEAQTIEEQVAAMLERANESARELQKQQLDYGRLEREHEEAEVLLRALRDRSTTAGLAGATSSAGAKIMQPAVVPTAPPRDVLLRNIALGALVGLAAAAALRRIAG